MSKNIESNTLHSLPDDLLEADGKSIKLIRLLQAKGFNRDVRRRLTEHSRGVRGAEAKMATSVSDRVVHLPEPEQKLVARWSNPQYRAHAFWAACHEAAEVGARPGGFAATAYAQAVDLLFLEEFDSQWHDLGFDEAELLATCDTWPEIKRELEKVLGATKRKASFEVFMLWPRIVEELSRWTQLDALRRRAVVHAIFALCSVALNDWFARRSIELCPELAGHFPVEDREPPNEGESCPPESRDKEVEDWRVAWDALLRRLDGIREELGDRPTRRSVADLVEIGRECQALAPHLPEADEALRERVLVKVAALLDLCRAWGEKPNFQWLDDSVLQLVETGWQAALGETGGALATLADDADAARNRTEAAGATYETEAAERQVLQEVLEGIERGTRKAKSLPERMSHQKSMRKKERALLDLEERLEALQEAFLAAASPFGRLPALVADTPSEAGGDEKPGDGFTGSDESIPGGTRVFPDEPVAPVAKPIDPRVDSAAPTEELPTPSEEANLPAEERQPPQEPLPLATAARGRGAPPQAVVRSVEVGRSAQEPLDRSGKEPTTGESGESSAVPWGNDDAVYSAYAGEACRPIWTLLARGYLGMACQFASALAEQDSGIRTPPVELLQAVALAHALVYPDGGLHESVATTLQNLSEGWFHEEGPHSWHTALNLLLVAATLRPMILAPGSGASTILGYLHLDSEGRYRSLYSLVRSLRDYSERLQGFPINLASIRSIRSQAAIGNDFSALRAEADDWLRTQAPAVTIKFAAATKVWQAWLRPGGSIARLVEPVVENRTREIDEVKALIRSVSDPAEFKKLVRKTDRKEIGRPSGEDIHSGALDHLGRCTMEAVVLARRWVTLVECQTSSSNEMRNLLLSVSDKLRQTLEPVRSELTAPDREAWGLVSSAQKVALGELEAVCRLFDPEFLLPESEPSADEVMARELLLVPSLRICDDWSVETPAALVQAIRDWVAEPVSPRQAFDARLHDGDVFGARLLLGTAIDDEPASVHEDDLRRERDSWGMQLSRRVQEVRREIEVGSAYGYVSDADRSAWEGELVLREARVSEEERFDRSIRGVNGVSERVRQNLARKAAGVRRAMSDLSTEGASATDIAEVGKALEEGDIATANELLERVRAGLPPWPEDKALADPFASFMLSVAGLEEWLNNRRNREPVDATIKRGEPIPGLDLSQVAGAQRDQAAGMFTDWNRIKAKKAAEAGLLRSFFTGLGFILPSPPSREEESPGRMEVWTMSSTLVEDRAVCPIPHFGSGANGRYRVICLWERPAEDDIVRMIGESSLHRATIVLYFGRMSERKWRDMSLKTKRTHKSFLLLDEVMLLFLAGERASRLAAFFSTVLPFAYSDPYDATAGLVPPEMFFGRAAELQAIFGVNGRCFIYGGRQLGKTALMRRAEQQFHAPEAGRHSIWIDLRAEGIGVNRSAAEIWVPIAASLKAAKVLTEATGSAAVTKKSGVEALLKQLGVFLEEKPGRRILLLLDEADRFFEEDGRHDFAETRRLKQLMDVTQRRFKVVFAGLHNVLRMTERANHPLAHFGEPIKIGPFIDESEIREAKDLVCRPFMAAGFEFDSRSLVIRILAQTNYYPSLIQLYCHHLLRHMLAKVATTQRLAGPRYRVTSQDIEAVYSSGDLRDEIRHKFRLTLQLDLRYEVVAYAIALETLAGKCPHNVGMDWRSIWDKGAMPWWPEGFRGTGELEFRVLLDEMVALGVLSRNPQGRYSLRNPNIFLLLGNQEEIEAVLLKERKPTGEFDSSAFRPHRRDKPDSPLRSPLTYHQLSELLRQENRIMVIAGSEAAGADDLRPALRDYLQSAGTGTFFEVSGCPDPDSFRKRLESFNEKKVEGVNLVVVAASDPWSGIWVRKAKEFLDDRRSPQKFLTVVFLADPRGLWGAMADEVLNSLNIPWMSMLPWRASFVAQWLEDLKLPNKVDMLAEATGLWPFLLYSLVEQGISGTELDRRIDSLQRAQGNGLEIAGRLAGLGLDVPEPTRILKMLAELESATPGELAEFLECESELAARALRWAELLGLARRERDGRWSIDPIAQRLLLAESQ